MSCKRGGTGDPFSCLKKGIGIGMHKNSNIARQRVDEGRREKRLPPVPTRPKTGRKPQRLNPPETQVKPPQGSFTRERPVGRRQQPALEFMSRATRRMMGAIADRTLPLRRN